MGVGTLVAVVFGLALAAVARGHRYVGGFVLGVAVTVGLLAASATVVAAPGIWLSLYRFVIGGYEGGS
jgi:hypothetical protein